MTVTLAAARARWAAAIEPGPQPERLPPYHAPSLSAREVTQGQRAMIAAEVSKLETYGDVSEGLTQARARRGAAIVRARPGPFAGVRPLARPRRELQTDAAASGGD
jgi:hypothetical protein